MQNYSYNGSRKGMVFALMGSIDASYKDLGAVCDAIRYRKASNALETLEAIASGKSAVYYRRNNRGFGARHELGGRKGRYPMKAARVIRRVLVNAMANSKNKGYDVEDMAVAHASANKEQILSRAPSKGVMYLGTGITGHTFGYSPARRSNLEYARVEIGLASGMESELSGRAKYLIKKYGKETSRNASAKVQAKPQPAGAKAKKENRQARPQSTAKESMAKAEPQAKGREEAKPNKTAVANQQAGAKGESGK